MFNALPSVGHFFFQEPAMPRDLESIRSQFPALAREHNGHPVAYFDGPGGTQVPRSVVEAMSEYLYHHNANRHWGFPTSDETDGIVDGAREIVADFLNARPDEAAFGPNMTTLTFHLSRALGRDWGPGDAVVVTELDHHANIDPWKALEKERGVTVRMARLDPETGQLDMGHLEQLLVEHPRLLAIGAASNALGTINDVKRACRAARAVGAATFVDAVHYAPHELVDVREFGCDFLACSAYKFYGPHLGILYGKKGLMDSLDFPKLQPAPEAAPDRAETGTQNHEGIAGTAAAIEFLGSMGGGLSRRQRLADVYSQLRQRGREQLRQLWDGLSVLPGVTLYGPSPDQPRTPTLSLTVEGIPSAEVSRHLAELGVFVSHGDFYASTVVDRLGRSAQGLVRIGCACYTTGEEIDRVVRGVRPFVA